MPASELFQIVQHSTACTAAVERHNTPASGAALCENVLKHHNLALPVAAELRVTIETYFPDVARVGEKAIEEC